MSFGEPSELEAAYSDDDDVTVRNNPQRGDAQLRVQVAPEDGESASIPFGPALDLGFEPAGVASNFTTLGDGTFTTTVLLSEGGE